MNRSKEETAIRKLWAPDNLVLLVIAAGKLAINVAFHGRYGYFRDELYYLACSNHLAWGYVDHPPLSIALLSATRALLGDSLHAIRLPAAVAGCGVVVLAGLMARRLGGGRAAQAIAALATALSPVVLGNAGRTFSMNAFDLLFWAWAAYLVIVILQEDRPKLWVAFGAVAGLGLINKYSMLFFGFGLTAGLLLTRHRREFLRPWIWLGGLAAAVIFLPHVAWEWTHDWASLEFMRIASQEKNVSLSVSEFLSDQILQNGFAQAVLWIAGLAWFAFHPGARRLRVMAWIYPVVFAVMVANGAKAYYLSPIYPPYLAAGAVWLEAVTAQGRRKLLRPGFAVIMTALSLAVLPLVVPCLSVEGYIRYSQALGFAPRSEENHTLEALPQYYADQFGWEEFVDKVAVAYTSLSPDEREHCVIYVRNYGEAAAVDFFGPSRGLPHATSPHNAYWHWGPGDPEMKAAIIVGGEGTEEENLADLESPERFGKAVLAAVTDCEYCMPFERGRQIFACRDPRFSFQDIWEQERFFY